MNSLIRRGWRVAMMVWVALGGSLLMGWAEPINPKWEAEIATLTVKQQERPAPDGVILFTGSSSIRRWDTLAADFPQHAVLNRGFGGSQLSDLIAYFEPLFSDVKPGQIVIYSGTNDLNAGESAERVLGDLATLGGMLRIALPETKIAFIGAAPNPARWAQRDAQIRFNQLVAGYCAQYGHDFIDVWTPMLGEDGTPSRDIYVADGLHMNAAGYVMWKAIVAPYLIK